MVATKRPPSEDKGVHFDSVKHDPTNQTESCGTNIYYLPAAVAAEARTDHGSTNSTKTG